MAESPPQKLDLTQVVVHVSGDGAATAYPLGESFWSDLAAGKLFSGGWLVSKFDFSGRWDHWEMHPRGEEIVCLTGGAVDFTFDLGDRHDTITLDSVGAYVIVPRGTWHIAEAKEPSSVLVITAGDGTEHRPD